MECGRSSIIVGTSSPFHTLYVAKVAVDCRRTDQAKCSVTTQCPAIAIRNERCRRWDCRRRFQPCPPTPAVVTGEPRVPGQ